MDDDRRSMTGEESGDNRRSMLGRDVQERREHAQAVEEGRIQAGGATTVPHERLLDQSVGVDPIEELRRDVARLEGKVDALLAALEVDDGDE